MRFPKTLLAAAIAATLVGHGALAQTHWVGTWGAAPSPQLQTAEMESQKLVFHDQTLREIVHVSIGGDTVRVRLRIPSAQSLLKLTLPTWLSVRLIRASPLPPIAPSLSEDAHASKSPLAPSSSVTPFSSKSLPPLTSRSVSISRKALSAVGIHYSAQQTSYIAHGDSTATASVDNPATITSWVFLTGVDVLASAGSGSIIAFGDSITDGARSTVDSNHRWPDTLAARLLARQSGPPLAVVDMGIGGNRILHEGAASKRPQFGINALARFDQDVLSQPGVRYLLILEGINDIGHAGSSAPASEAVTADDIIAGLNQMIERAHERGVKVMGATITPFEGEANIKRGYWTPEKAKVREAVNAWIRSGKGFDGFVDFDKVVRNPANPNKLLPAFDSGDQLHPSDAGYKAIGEAIPLSLFGLK